MHIYVPVYLKKNIIYYAYYTYDLFNYELDDSLDFNSVLNYGLLNQIICMK